jgi:hypothetical protein
MLQIEMEFPKFITIRINFSVKVSYSLNYTPSLGGPASLSLGGPASPNHGGWRTKCFVG